MTNQQLVEVFLEQHKVKIGKYHQPRKEEIPFPPTMGVSGKDGQEINDFNKSAWCN